MRLHNCNESNVLTTLSFTSMSAKSLFFATAEKLTASRISKEGPSSFKQFRRSGLAFWFVWRNPSAKIEGHIVIIYSK